MEVGVRELRNNLSRYLGRVAAGVEITVTDRGRAVARIQPIGDRPLDRLIAAGLVSPARKPSGWAKGRRVHVTEPIGPLVGDQRR